MISSQARTRAVAVCAEGDGGGWFLCHRCTHAARFSRASYPRSPSSIGCLTIPQPLQRIFVWARWEVLQSLEFDAKIPETDATLPCHDPRSLRFDPKQTRLLSPVVSRTEHEPIPSMGLTPSSPWDAGGWCRGPLAR